MRIWQKVLALIVTVVAVEAVATDKSEGTNSAPSLPATAPAVLKYVPRGALAVLVVGDVRRLTDHADALAARTAIGGAALPEALAALKDQLKLGEGFDASGSAAVVLLSPRAIGLDVRDLADAQTARDNLPLVMLLPGHDVSKMFPEDRVARIEKAKELWQVRPHVLARELDGFVAVSPSAAALAAVAAAGETPSVRAGKMPATLPATHAADAQRFQVPECLTQPGDNDLVIWADVPAIMAEAEKVLSRQQAGSAPAGLTTSAPSRVEDLIGRLARTPPALRALLERCGPVELSAAIAPEGLRLELAVSSREPGTRATSAPATSAPAAELLSRLPDRPYVLALGAARTHATSAPATTSTSPAGENPDLRRHLEAVLGEKFFQPLTPEARATLLTEVARIIEGTTAVQVYIGSARSAGVAAASRPGSAREEPALPCGAAFVARGPSAPAIKQSLRAIMPIIVQLLAASSQTDVAATKLIYQPGAARLGEVSVDRLAIDNPAFAALSDTQSALLRSLAGDDPFGVLVGEASGEVLVVTYGGGREFMKAALAAATAQADTPKLTASAPVAEALKHLPPGASALALLDAGDLSAILQALCRQVGETALKLPSATHVPLAVAGYQQGNSRRVVLLLPAEVLRDARKAVGAAVTFYLIRALRRNLENPEPRTRPNGPPVGRNP